MRRGSQSRGQTVSIIFLANGAHNHHPIIPHIHYSLPTLTCLSFIQFDRNDGNNNEQAEDTTTMGAAFPPGLEVRSMVSIVVKR